jgi:hypothetical protein
MEKCYLMFQSVFTREAGVGVIQLETIDGKTTKYVRSIVGDELHVVSWRNFIFKNNFPTKMF